MDRVSSDRDRSTRRSRDDRDREDYKERHHHRDRENHESSKQHDDRDRDHKRSRDHRHSSSSKRKDYDEEEERREEPKRSRDERSERKRRFEEDSSRTNGDHKGDERSRKRRERSFSDSKDLDGRERFNGEHKSGTAVNVAAKEPQDLAPTVAASDRLISKVSPITETNNIRSHEATTTKSSVSTDETASTAPSVPASKTATDNALAKAKRALQLQKELSEKLKKLPLRNKAGSTSSENSIQVASKPVAATQTASSDATVNQSVKPGTVGTLGSVPVLTGTNLEAVKKAQELAAKMLAPSTTAAAAAEAAAAAAPTASAADVADQPQKPTKAPRLFLDKQGRATDEYGNVIDISRPTNTLKVNINKQKKEAFQIIKPDLDAIAASSSHFDPTMGFNKTKLFRPKRNEFQFVKEGQFSKLAEMQRVKSQFGEAQAKELKVKQAQLAKAKAEPDINPNLIAVGARIIKEKKKEEIPDIEWWDKPILLSATYKDEISKEKLNMEKITIYVEHPRPIEPPAEPAPPPPQPLKLTKRERKKLRTQKRIAKEKDRQEMIRQGLLDPPKPKVKISNLMKVLGSEATQDPTRLEMEVRTAAAEREQAHVDRNAARKLTPSERREKKEKKLFNDPGALETLVSVYRVRDLSHQKTRFKVDVNAQENRLTGCAVISDELSVVVVEGGKKSIKRYGKLMLTRIDWASLRVGEVGDEGEGDYDDEEREGNSCVLVWQGSVAKPSFHRFLVHNCMSDAAARKVFADAGVPHYWDLAVNFSED